MSDIEKLSFPDSVKYSKEHTWAMVEGELIVVGISDFAQSELGEIVFVELPETGEFYGTDWVFGFVESIKTASDLHMPIGGEVVEINEELEDAPEIINTDPYGKGWMLKIKADTKELDSLMDAAGYLKSIGK